MDRNEQLRRFVCKEYRGIEIGPWCTPVTPKREGFDCLVLDVFDTETLHRRAMEDSGLPNEIVAGIESVDLVGSSVMIGDLVRSKGAEGAIHYIVSSHNFEHIPDPIRFLQGCESALTAGGVVSMAIPDKRGCFDYYRPLTTAAQFVEAYFEKRSRPTRAQIFERFALHAKCDFGGRELIGFPIGVDPVTVKPFETLEIAFDAWKQFQEFPDDEYVDTHCWTFTPASAELILRDIIYLGLIQLELIEVVEGGENEFYVHLRKPAKDSRSLDREHFYRTRANLLSRVLDESSPTLAAQVDKLERERIDLLSQPDCGLAQPESDENASTILGELANLRSELRNAQAKMKDLEAARSDAEGRVSAILRSSSWRLSSPVRVLGGLLGSIGRRRILR